jgi:Ni/Fe-hydrogenase subunit HybB-like protein
MVWDTPPNAFVLLRWIMVGSLVGHVAAVFLGEVVARHGSSNAAAAAHVMTHGTYAPLFWTGVSIGAVVPVVLLMASGSPGVIIGSAVLSLAGLLAYEHAFVMSGQSVPIS